MKTSFELDDYTRRRFDRAVEDVAVTRNKVEGIERFLVAIKDRVEVQETRLARVERKIFALWLIGPLLVGVFASLRSLRAWVMEN